VVKNEHTSEGETNGNRGQRRAQAGDLTGRDHYKKSEASISKEKNQRLGETTRFSRGEPNLTFWKGKTVDEVDHPENSGGVEERRESKSPKEERKPFPCRVS